MMMADKREWEHRTDEVLEKDLKNGNVYDAETINLWTSKRQ
jgi:hypothetical protein